jgi:hypothetical protein
MSNNKSFLTLDPGSVGTGYALFVPECTLPAYYGILQTGNEVIWLNYEQLLKTMKPGCVYAEYPSYLQSFRGLTSAKSGNLIKLAVNFGGLQAITFSQNILWKNVPLKWKGNIPKEIMHNRIRQQLPTLSKDAVSHALDAIGIGLYVKKEML